MFELSQEQDLLAANDRSVVLTTHRVVLYTQQKKEQVMLADIISWTMGRKDVGNYKNLVIIFLGLSIATAIGLLIDHQNRVEMFSHIDTAEGVLRYAAGYNELLVALMYLFGFLLLCSCLFLLLGTRLMIRVKGKFNDISFRIRNEKSGQKFIDTMMEESAKRKMEQL